MNPQIFQDKNKRSGRPKFEFFLLIFLLLLLAVFLSLLTVLITTFRTFDTTPPTITIVSPQNITYVTSSVPLTFMVSEPTSWIGYSVNNQANITITGNTTMTGLAEGSNNVMVYGNDSSGNMGASERVHFTVTVNNPPTAPTVQITPKIAYTTNDLVCTIIHASSDPDGNVVTYKYDWFIDGVLQQNTSTAELTDVLSSNLTAKGETWICMVTPNDGLVDGPSGQDQVTIQNSTPTAPIVDVSPDLPVTTDELKCDIVTPSLDPDGDSVSYTYEWYKNSVIQNGLTTNTVSYFETSKEETWKCVVRPNDGIEEGLTGEDSVTILNSPPEAFDVRITPSAPFTGDDLTGSYGLSDADEDEELGTEIRWFKNEVLQSTYNDMLTLPSTATSEGEEWYFTVRPKDGTDFGTLVKSNVVMIQETPEYTITVHSSPSGVPFAVDGESQTTPWSGTFSQGTLVSLEMPSNCMIGEAKYFWSGWSDDETNQCRTVMLNKNISLTGQFSGPYYELVVTSSPITGITFTIDGMNETTPHTEWLPPGPHTLIMPETYGWYVWSHWLEDGDTNRTKTITLPSTTWTGVYTPETTPPSITIISPQNITYATSSVSLTFFVNEPTSWIGYSVNNQANITITGNTTMTDLANGRYSVIIYANDTVGNMGASERVHFTVAVNNPPTAPTVQITPKIAYTTNDLVCTVTNESIDLDGDPVFYRYEWFKNGELQQTINTTELTNTLSSTLTTKDEVWTCVVTPNDGQVDGPSDEEQVTIQNSSPEAQNLTILPTAPDTTFNLNASYSYVDADGDPESGSEIRWYKDGLLQSAYNDLKILPSNATCRGEEWYFTVKPKDGVDFGDLETLPSVIIQNAPPAKPVVEIHPDSPRTTDDLICNISLPSFDPDGDSVTYKYEWYKDDVLQPELTSKDVSESLTVKFQVWKCIVTPNDGIDDGESGEDSATILNTPPTRPVIDVTPDSPDTTDDLICTIITPSYDLDGDTITYRFDWYKNNVRKLTGEMVLSLITDEGETWKCVVTPNDGTEDGPPGKDLVTISYETTVYVDPQESVVKFGQTFKVNVSIADVSGLQGFDFCLSYNSTILDCLEVEEGPFMAGFGPTIIAKLEIDDQYNGSQGRVWMAVVIYGNGSASGRGTLATITFNATASGEGSFDLHSILPYNPDAVKLSTCEAEAISNRAVDGYFEILSDPDDPPSDIHSNKEGINTVNLAIIAAVYGISTAQLNCSSATDLRFIKYIWTMASIYNTLNTSLE